ncbi:MAG: hypothetical protein MZV65_43980 [Chromatiales bacterium]|nr:hypothetical protein [Chromatiales bacterium]
MPERGERLAAGRADAARAADLPGHDAGLLHRGAATRLWWLMVSDRRQCRAPGWRPLRLRRAGRQDAAAAGARRPGAAAARRTGITTTANAWGVLAHGAILAARSKPRRSPAATARASWRDVRARLVDWQRRQDGGDVGAALPWPSAPAELAARARGHGPAVADAAERWRAVPLQAAAFRAAIASRAAVTPMRAARSRSAGARGDIAARAARDRGPGRHDLGGGERPGAGRQPRSWAAASGGDSRILTRGRSSAGAVWPAFEERALRGVPRLLSSSCPRAHGAWNTPLRLNQRRRVPAAADAGRGDVRARRCSASRRTQPVVVKP